ncbi:MAG: sulfite exporter TauE/SafE family protein [Thermodesulfobacteriota bacterium]
MNTREILTYVAMGAGCGFLIGLLGVSTGLVLVPALVFILKWGQKLSQGTALAVSLPPVGLLAVMDYYHDGNVHIPAAVIMAIGIFIGSHYGGKLAMRSSPEQLRFIFGSLLLLIGVKMLIGI